VPSSRRWRRARLAAGRRTSPGPVRTTAWASGTNTPHDSDEQHGGHAHVARSAQREATAQVEAVEDLECSRDPQQHDSDGHYRWRVGIRGVDEGRQHPRPRERQQHADGTHQGDGQQDHRVAHLASPLAIARADGLADERGAGERDAHARQVSDRGQHHHELGRSAFDSAQPHLHELEQREPEDIGRVHGAHRQAQPVLAHEARQVRAPRQVRFIQPAQVGSRNTPNAKSTPQAMLILVAQAAPAMPPSSLKMNSQSSTPLTSATRPSGHDGDARARDAVEESE
jgi:hypothetical protein